MRGEDRLSDQMIGKTKKDEYQSPRKTNKAQRKGESGGERGRGSRGRRTVLS